MSMRIFLAAGLLAATAQPAAATDMSGEWVISAPPANPVCNFTQAGDFFRGTCEGSDAKGMAFGVIDSQIVRWTYQWTLRANGHPGAFVFWGQFDADGSLTGVVMSTNGTYAKFTAKHRPNSN